MLLDKEIKIIYEDEFIISVYKPNGVLVHHSFYARDVKEDSLIQILRKQKGIKLHLINRLDRKTSGIVLLCKDSENVIKFQNLFNNKEITKTYVGLVRGYLMRMIEIDSPIKNDENKKHQKALTIVEGIRQIEINKPVGKYGTGRYTLCLITPETGRTHQIRKHLNKISHPLIGDHKYGDRFHNKLFAEDFNLKNMFLHAYQIKFIHPINNKEIEIYCPLPMFWGELKFIFGEDFFDKNQNYLERLALDIFAEEF